MMQSRVLPLFIVMQLLYSASCNYGSRPNYSSLGLDGGVGGAATGGAAGTSASNTSAGVSNRCVENGVTYFRGDVISTDKCGACYCVVGGLNSCTTTSLNIPTTCDYAGIGWYLGDAVPVLNDCNSCTCQDQATDDCPHQGAMSCTKLDCTGACSYAGRTYPSGASFPATDGCNQCNCSSGTVDCTRLDCICNPNQEPWRDYRGTNRTTDCARLQLTCPVGTTQFTNACGCGCEQRRDCPISAWCGAAWASSGATIAEASAIPALPVVCDPTPVCPYSVNPSGLIL